MTTLKQAQEFAAQLRAGVIPATENWLQVPVTIQCSHHEHCTNREPHEQVLHYVNADMITRSVCSCGAPNNLIHHWDAPENDAVTLALPPG